MQTDNTEAERVLAGHISAQALEIAALVNALVDTNQRLAHVEAAYREVREILTPKQKVKLGIED